MQKEGIGRSLNRAYYYHQQRKPDDRSQNLPNLNMNMAFCRASCSDSDSGICADSGSEHSHPSPKLDSNSDSKYPDWRAVPNFLQSTSMSSLKVRQGSPCRVTKKHGKPLKVRFADVQTDSDTDSACKHAISSPSPPPLPPPPSLNYYYINPGSNPKPNNLLKFPYPPPYEVALNRIHQINSDGQQSRTRSSSLGRDCGRRQANNYCRHEPSVVNAILSQNCNFSTCSVEKISEPNFSTFPRNSSKKHSPSVPNPGIMPAGSCDDIVHLESIDVTTKCQTKPKFALTSTLQKLARKLGSQEKIIFTDIDKEVNNMHALNCSDTARSPGVCDPLPDNVKARLVGIDNKGVHVIELQKLEDGPFGFYISTGTFKRKKDCVAESTPPAKGVYVSRITVRNLHTFLHIGDRLLQIDNVNLKGKNLEQIQSMMTNKDKVILKILPLLS